MTPDEIAADRAVIDAATSGPGPWTAPGYEVWAAFIAAARTGWPRALDALEAAQEGNDSLGAMVEWLAEVIVDARDACQRAESIEPMGSPEWVESGIAMRTTVLREVRAILDRERNAHPSALDKVTAERDEALAEIVRLRSLIGARVADANDEAQEALGRALTAEAEVERLREEAATGPSWNAVALRSALVAMTVERDDLRAAHERLDRDARAVAGRSLHYEALAEATRLADEVERLRRIERAEVADLKFDVERLEKAVDVLAASVNAATIRAEKAEAAIERVRSWCDDYDNHQAACAYWQPFPTGTVPVCDCSVRDLRAALEGEYRARKNYGEA